MNRMNKFMQPFRTSCNESERETLAIIHLDGSITWSDLVRRVLDLDKRSKKPSERAQHAGSRKRQMATYLVNTDFPGLACEKRALHGETVILYTVLHGTTADFLTQAGRS